MRQILQRRSTGEVEPEHDRDGFPMELSVDDLDWLRGVRDGASDDDVRRDAETLLAALDQYGVIELSLVS
jgi:hypothetical protein